MFRRLHLAAFWCDAQTLTLISRTFACQMQTWLLFYAVHGAPQTGALMKLGTMQAYGVPVIGVWVSGVASPTHPLVWLACLKFFATTQLQDKVTQGDQAFLLLLYAAGSIPGSCDSKCCLYCKTLLLSTNCKHACV
jgi:hypothetical protein